MESKLRRARIGRIAAKTRTPTIEDLVGRWKMLHLESVRLEARLVSARGDVKQALVTAGVEHAVTPYGTIALQHRAGSVKTDWEALARSLLTPELINEHLPAYTTQGEPAVVLAAPREWTVEAKASL